MADTGRSFAEKLDHLFRVVRPRDGGEYSYREVAARVATDAGPQISASYIWQLRTGVKGNPTKRHIEALAGFFGVSPGYFFDAEEAELTDEQLAALASLRDAGVQSLALRAAGLSPQSLNLIAELVERTRQLEGLDPPGGSA